MAVSSFVYLGYLLTNTSARRGPHDSLPFLGVGVKFEVAKGSSIKMESFGASVFLVSYLQMGFQTYLAFRQKRLKFHSSADEL